ncbi:uncharacterized protein LOC125460381 [Stegostoma tigrinum]|uniref:uncharacterized protein LOC125460381 n=1 Tax=Stegostoma tigrinum TaxID=3053191 RepID=UPI00202B0253|nr:uncharacterized protein LOC125460381 [Stegostoma tigrinum]XP_048403776.1 uncharacterized protein LOC125460381 [Stegostoma tigrinum]XP_048403777.1 uncharacterized protein LOC125460381 [Stegostoma tigrinum]
MFVTSLQFPSAVCPGNSNGEEANTVHQPSTIFGRSRTEKAVRRAQRRSNMSAVDLRREEMADKLKYPLVLLAPVILILMLLLILFGIYILKPFHKALNFTGSTCTVLGIQQEPQGSCGSGRDTFSPCVQIKVIFHLPNGSKRSAIIMENEQALVNCQQCSFTFGRHGVFADRLVNCQGWREDYSRPACVMNYLQDFGQINTTFPCFYNPFKSHEVIREKQLTWGMAVNSLLWPLLGFFGYGAAGAFVLVDCRKRRKLNTLLENQDAKTEKEKEPMKRRRRGSKIACRHGNNFSSYPTVISGSLSCTCLDHAMEDRQTTSTPRVEASWTRPSAVLWTEQDLLDLEHLDLAVAEYTQSRPPSIYSNVYVSQDGEALADSEIEWSTLRGNMDFGISEQDVDYYFASISRRHSFRQNILPFHPFMVMGETRV